MGKKRKGYRPVKGADGNTQAGELILLLEAKE